MCEALRQGTAIADPSRPHVHDFRRIVHSSIETQPRMNSLIFGALELPSLPPLEERLKEWENSHRPAKKPVLDLIH